jgi:mannose-6-phosphate isomerase-like protein (cupin superfamily)
MNQAPFFSVRVIDSTHGCPEIPIVEGEGSARVVLSPHNGGQFRSFQLIELQHQARTISLRHGSDCVYYVMNGAGCIIDLADQSRIDLVEGHMVHIDAGDCYRIEAGDAGLKVVGGPCPPDPDLYAGMTSTGARS